MDSKLNHAIMLRSKLRKKFLKSRSNHGDIILVLYLHDLMKIESLQETAKSMR